MAPQSGSINQSHASSRADAAVIRRTIARRRSVRTGYNGEPVDRSVIDALVDAALAAPSSKNAQPWRLHVVEDRPLLAAIADAADRSPEVECYVPVDAAVGQPNRDWRSTVNESSQVLRDASLAIFVENRCEFSSGRKAIFQASAEIRSAALIGYSLELLGIGAAIQNMWLVATAYGMQAVFMGDLLIVEDLISAELGFDGELIGIFVAGFGFGSAYRLERFYESDRVVRHNR